MIIEKRSPRFVEARESLPERLREIYDQLVASYAYHSLRHHGREFVSYSIIADLVRDGWRVDSQPDNRNASRQK
jgi:hypothetical protein